MYNILIMERLLLHTCCGPCFLGTWEDLKDSSLQVTNYFYNPNIQPNEEYRKRLDNFKKAAQGKTELIIEEAYDQKEHKKAISGLEDKFLQRCVKCYELRLEKTAKKASEEGYDYFSTTLLVSPYQQHETLKEIGENLGKKYSVNFYYRDFRPHYREGQEAAKKGDIYRQRYCGCLYSKEYR
jgi:predicted adenine nucleotide alpha hydrolase (AANH) superfamily ATPase